MNAFMSPYPLVMAAAAFICAVIGLIVLRYRRDNSETMPLFLLMAGIVEWIVAALLGLLDPDPVRKILWAKIEYIGVVSVPVAVLAFVLRHSGSRRQLTMKALAGLALIPLATLILAWTNEQHAMIWARYVPYREGGLMLSDKTYGPGFWLYWGYSYLLLLVSMIISLRSHWTAARIFRRQSLLVEAGILAPWIGNLLSVTKINPFGKLDLTPLAFSLTGIMLFIGMFRWRLFDIKPIARAAAVERMADGLLILDNRGTIVSANPSARAILGFDQDGLAGKKMDHFLPDWPPAEPRPDGKEGIRIEFSRQTNGAERSYELHASPIQEKRGGSQGTIVLLHDATTQKQLEKELKEAERRHAELLLRQSEARFATIFHANPAAMSLSRFVDSAFVDANAAWEDLTGYLRAEALGQTAAEMKLWAHPELRPAVIEDLQARRKLRTEMRLRRKTGEARDVLLSVEVIEQDGESYMLSILQDITDRKKAEEQIKKDLREKEILLRELYHRTKNNMQVICSILHLQSSRVEDPGMRELLKEIERKIGAMALVHQNLLKSKDLSRLNLKEYLEDFFAYFKLAFLSPLDRISLRVEMEDVSVLIDTAVPLGLVVNELFSNALKHAFPDQAKGEIALKLSVSPRREIMLDISDNGRGWPESFDLGKDVHLGLETAIVLVEQQLNGKIFFESRNGLHCRIVLGQESYQPRI